MITVNDLYFIWQSGRMNDETTELLGEEWFPWNELLELLVTRLPSHFEEDVIKDLH